MLVGNFRGQCISRHGIDPAKLEYSISSIKRVVNEGKDENEDTDSDDDDDDDDDDYEDINLLNTLLVLARAVRGPFSMTSLKMSSLPSRTLVAGEREMKQLVEGKYNSNLFHGNMNRARGINSLGPNVSKQTIIASDNGLLPGQRQAII